MTMGEMVIFNDGDATIVGGQFEEPQNIVIYCDLCNEPLAITPEVNDMVFITCLKCHAVNGVLLTVGESVNDEPTPQA
jgi:hypothetical protein